jgi:repressor LexA
MAGRPPSIGITAPQSRTLNEIQAFAAQHGYPPTIKELAEILGISHASAHEQIGQLIRKGYLRHEPGKSRGVTIVREAEGHVAELVAVPVVGRVVAGPPLFAEQNITGEILVDSAVVRQGRCFALEVQGDSMKGVGITADDLLVVRQQPVADNGDIVVALLDGDATVKRLSVRGAQVELQPENARYKPIRVGPESDFRIVGKVVGVWKRPARTRGRAGPSSRSD